MHDEPPTSSSPVRELYVYLAVRGAAAAIAFYTNVFRGQERMRLTEPDGRIAHAEVQLGPRLSCWPMSGRSRDSTVRRPTEEPGLPFTCTLTMSTPSWNGPSRREPSSSASPQTRTTGSGRRSSEIPSVTSGCSGMNWKACPTKRFSAASRPRQRTNRATAAASGQFVAIPTI